MFRDMLALYPFTKNVRHNADISAQWIRSAIRRSKLTSAILSTCDGWVPMIAVWLAFVTQTLVRHEAFPVSTALILPKV